MERIDIELVRRSGIKSRTAAQQLIKEGIVFVNGNKAQKASLIVSDDDVIEIRGELPKFVGRGGLKLEGAFKKFGISVEGKICIDAGASTGGFTDCMLRYGASLVYAVDVGSNQLDGSLRENKKVVSLENTDIRALGEKTGIKADFVGADLSFISLKLVLPCIKELLNERGQAVALVKPQFEVGRRGIGKKGIVKDKALREKAVKDVGECAEALGFKVLGIAESPVTGGDGNVEYLMWLSV